MDSEYTSKRWVDAEREHSPLAQEPYFKWMKQRTLRIKVNDNRACSKPQLRITSEICMPIRPLIYIIRLINFRPPLPTQDPSENPHNALTPKNPHNDQSLPPPVSLPIRNHARSNSPVSVGNHKAGKLSSVSMLRVGLDLRRGLPYIRSGWLSSRVSR